MRRKRKKKNFLRASRVYDSEKISKLVNYVMREGKKGVANRVVYGALEEIKTKHHKDPVEVFEEAIKNVGPLMEVRSRRIGGANYQIPREVRPERRLQLALRWIVGAALAKKGKPMRLKLATELLAAAAGEGEAVKRRENVHKMAESNRAFAHFTW